MRRLIKVFFVSALFSTKSCISLKKISRKGNRRRHAWLSDWLFDWLRFRVNQSIHRSFEGRRNDTDYVMHTSVSVINQSISSSVALHTSVNVINQSINQLFGCIARICQCNQSINQSILRLHCKSGAKWLFCFFSYFFFTSLNVVLDSSQRILFHHVVLFVWIFL